MANTVEMDVWRHLRKIIFLPDDGIYANYTPQHDTVILPPTFFNKCINYNADSISTAMQNISAHFGKSGESGYKWIETNVVVACFPPWWVACRMHKFLDAFVQNNVKSNQERCFGIFLIDFCNSTLIKKIISFSPVRNSMMKQFDFNSNNTLKRSGEIYFYPHCKIHHKKTRLISMSAWTMLTRSKYILKGRIDYYLAPMNWEWGDNNQYTTNTFERDERRQNKIVTKRNHESFHNTRVPPTNMCVNVN